MRELDRDQLKQIIEKGHEKEVTLLNVLGREAFEDKHLPGSINIPVSKEDFIDHVQKAIGGRDQPVVVYCAGFDCDASDTAAEQLEQAGFSGVMHYAGGTADWEDAGYPLETGAVAQGR